MFDDASIVYEPEGVEALASLVSPRLRRIPLSESAPPRRDRREPAAHHGGLLRGPAPQRELAIGRCRVDGVALGSWTSPGDFS